MSSAGRTSRIPTYVSVTSTVVILVLACLLGLASSAEAAPRLGGGGPLPLAFEPNQGQADPSIKFLARGCGYGLFLTPSETVLVLAPATRQGPRAQRPGPVPAGVQVEPAVVRMRFVGADPDAHIEGVTPLPGRSHSFVGEQGRWRRDACGTKRTLTDAFVVRFAPTGDALDYCVFLGGTGDDSGQAITADAAGNVWVVSVTTSTNLPVMSALQAARGGRSDGFVGRLNASGAVVYLTYLGGAGDDMAVGVAIDALATRT